MIATVQPSNGKLMLRFAVLDWYQNWKRENHIFGAVTWTRAFKVVLWLKKSFRMGQNQTFNCWTFFLRQQRISACRDAFFRSHFKQTHSNWEEEIGRLEFIACIIYRDHRVGGLIPLEYAKNGKTARNSDSWKSDARRHFVLQYNIKSPDKRVLYEMAEIKIPNAQRRCDEQISLRVGACLHNLAFLMRTPSIFCTIFLNFSDWNDASMPHRWGSMPRIIFMRRNIEVVAAKDTTSPLPCPRTHTHTLRL